MGNPDFDTLATSTLRKYMGEFEDQIFKARPFLAWLQSKSRMNCQGGRSVVKELLEGENNTVTSFSCYDLLPCTPQKGLTAAEFTWSQYAVSIIICGLEEKMNSGPGENINLLRMKTYQAQESKKKRLARDLMLSDGTGNGGKDVAGLDVLVGNANHHPVYGGIDGSKPDCSYWQSWWDDAGYQDAIDEGLDPAEHAPPKPLTWRDIANALDCISCADPSDMPDLILTSKELYQGLRSTLEPHVMQTNPDMAKLGFSSIMYMGVTIMWDPDVPADTVWLLNSKYIDLVTLRGGWMEPTPFQKPHNQDARCSHILCCFTLCTNKRSAHGRLCNRKPAC